MRENYEGPVEFSIELAVENIERLLAADYGISKRSVALLLLQGDEEIKDIMRQKDNPSFEKILKLIKQAEERFANPVSYEIALERQRRAGELVKRAVKVEKESAGLRERLSRLTMNPLTGIPILFFVLYWGLYKFVGVFGAGTVVDFLEGAVFEEKINPVLVDFFTRLIPWPVFQDLLVGEYGLLTLGLRYAVALILPIVTFFFLIFSVIEDTGYLPRLAMLIDRTFKKIGLSGRAVIPMVLGFGCVTMATMVTRTLPTRRERVIATMLLALAVPCSAQLGVILALLGQNPRALVMWAAVTAGIFLLVGWLTAKMMPGEKPSFYMEVPPLRMPKVSNVLTKTFVRVKWYFKEILPLFLLASVLIWLGKLTRIFDLLIFLLRKPVELVGLPAEAAGVFLFGFFRRDYGAAGLYDINKQGLLTGNQLVIACVALTLFLPCVAQLLMNMKERGWKIGAGISLFVLFFSFSAAYTVNLMLSLFGVVL